MKWISPNSLNSSLTMLMVFGLFGSLTNPMDAQMFPEVIFDTQTEIDNFSGTTMLLGDLTIMDNGDDPITNLDGLTSLTLLFGNLNIMGNPDLYCYSGLIPLLENDGLMGSFDVVGN